MTLATALALVDRIFFANTGKHLNDLENTIIKQVWQGKKYLAIAEEYTLRYGKVHKSQAVIELAGSYFDNIPAGSRTNFVQAMPQEHTHCTDPTIAYKRYIKTKPYWPTAFRKGRDFTSHYD